MQISLKQSHIEAAIRDFVAKAGITFDVDEINFTAGRGKDGLIATVDLEDPFSAMLDKVADGAQAKPKKEKKEAVVEEEPEAQAEETPDQAFVSEEPEPSPSVSDKPKEEEAAAPAKDAKAGVSLFG